MTLKSITPLDPQPDGRRLFRLSFLTGFSDTVTADVPSNALVNYNRTRRHVLDATGRLFSFKRLEGMTRREAQKHWTKSVQDELSRHATEVHEQNKGPN